MTSNASAVRAAFDFLSRDQLPFATALALTRTAQDAREAIRKQMPSHFKIRSPRTVRGVDIERANKKDWPNIQAKVGTKDDFMALQITGGVKKPAKGAQRVAVPTRIVRRTSTGAIPARLKPRALREQKNVFVRAFDPAIIKRGAKFKGRVANLGETGVFFNLVSHANIPKRWPFVQEARDSVGSTYAKHFEQSMLIAVKSARVRAGSFTPEAGRAFFLKAQRSVR